MRSSRLQLFRRFMHEDPNAPFPEKCSNLKGKFRGKGQFRSSQLEAIAFLDANIGKNLEEWLNVKNATAALSVMSFFEVDHPYKAEIAHWLNSKMGTLTVQEKLDCGGVLVNADYSKYCDTVVGNIVNPLVRHAVPGMTLGELAIFCKIMQRCGNSVSSEAWTTVATQVQRKLTSDVGLGELVRFFSGFARRIPDSAVTLAILRSLIENGKSLKAFDYATVVASAGRLHISSPLPLDLFSKLAAQASEYDAYLNARDIATVLATIMRVRASYKVTPENITELWKVDNTIQVMLHSLNKTVIRFMNPNDERYWSSETDIVALIFAFESSGAKFPELFKAFNTFVRTNARKMEARNLALSLGILRRTGYLDEELARILSDRAGAVMDDFNAPELSHIVFTFMAVRGDFPQWMDRAKSRISSLLTPETPLHARLNIRASFPGDAGVISNVDLTEISLRQLHDVLKAPNIDAELRADAEKQLAANIPKLIAPSCAEIEALLEIANTNFCGLADAVKEVAVKILERDNWPVDVGALASLFDASQKEQYAKKAVASAAAYCESPTQFVSFAETMLNTFPENIDVREWVSKGATELVKPRSGIFLPPILALMELVTKYKMEMSNEWYTALLYGPISENATRLSVPLTATVLDFIKVLGVPSTHTEPVNFLLQQACERARTAEELLPVFVAAAKLKCVPLDEGWVAKLLELPALSADDRAILTAAEKAPSSVKSLSRQEHSQKEADAPKKSMVSGANSGSASVDAMSASLEEDMDSQGSSVKETQTTERKEAKTKRSTKSTAKESAKTAKKTPVKKVAKKVVAPKTAAKKKATSTKQTKASKKPSKKVTKRK